MHTVRSLSLAILVFTVAKIQRRTSETLEREKSEDHWELLCKEVEANLYTTWCCANLQRALPCLSVTKAQRTNAAVLPNRFAALQVVFPAGTSFDFPRSLLVR